SHRPADRSVGSTTNRCGGSSSAAAPTPQLSRRLEMKRGRSLLLAGAVLVGAQFIPASADTPPPTPDLPRLGCTHGVTDITGDAAPNYGGGSTTSAVFP